MGLFGSGKKPDLSDSREVWEAFFRAAMKNEWEKSLSFADSLKSLEPTNPQVFMKTGDILQRLGRGEEAIKSYHKAASLLEEANEGHKAIATYKIILRLDPSDNLAVTRSKALVSGLSAAAPAENPALEESGRQDAASFEDAPSAAESQAAPDTGAIASHATPAPAPQAKPRDLREAFARHPIFSVLSHDEIRFMSAKASHLSFDDGDVVIAEDTEGDSIYVIKKGRAGVSTSVADQTVRLANLGGLAFFGEGGFLTGAPRTATVRAMGSLELMEIQKDLLNEMVIRNPALLGKLVDLARARSSKSPPAEARG